MAFLAALISNSPGVQKVQTVQAVQIDSGFH
jgi:hypothetical protein